ncbi:hypothetical protein NQ176_g3390 [Zarea fungicola]|uniref:Uncharacterized protein n=1 Tax=Zarea fungicola TaxID=93591 RepID=A0ACC1NIX0_9HYPO|nr:hypothetical protein NQ176_g3390 [Lecanicillium fungicola]
MKSPMPLQWLWCNSEEKQVEWEQSGDLHNVINYLLEPRVDHATPRTANDEANLTRKPQKHGFHGVLNKTHADDTVNKRSRIGAKNSETAATIVLVSRNSATLMALEGKMKHELAASLRSGKKDNICQSVKATSSTVFIHDKPNIICASDENPNDKNRSDSSDTRLVTELPTKIPQAHAGNERKC